MVIPLLMWMAVQSATFYKTTNQKKITNDIRYNESLKYSYEKYKTIL
jgi:hypothetical protein